MTKIVPYRRHDANSQPSSLYEPYRATVLRAPRKPLIVLPHTLEFTDCSLIIRGCSPVVSVALEEKPDAPPG